MKSICLVLLLFTFTIKIYGSGANPQVLRRRFYQSVESAKVAHDFLVELQKDKSNPGPLVKGYMAATYMVMAKHAFNPYHKFKYFVTGRNELEHAIRDNPEVIELHLIRFAIQCNAPFFLNYSQNLKDDKQFLIGNIAKLNTLKDEDIQLKKYILDYLFHSEHCSDSEKEALLKA